MPGSAVLRRLRYVEATRDIPVVVVTADASPKSTRELLDGGAARYITKPVDAVELYDAIVATTGV